MPCAPVPCFISFILSVVLYFVLALFSIEFAMNMPTFNSDSSRSPLSAHTRLHGMKGMAGQNE